MQNFPALSDPPPLGRSTPSQIIFGDIEILSHFQRRSLANYYDVMNVSETACLTLQ